MTAAIVGFRTRSRIVFDLEGDPENQPLASQ